MRRKMNIGYIRISTIEQAIGGYSLVTQRQRIVDKFDKLGIKEYQIIEDDGYSAGTMERPGFSRIISLIKENRLNSLCFVNQDRLSRSISDSKNL